MPLPLLPTRIDLTAMSETRVTTTRLRAVVQDATYLLSFQILHEDGSPFDLGPTLTPNWTIRAQLRRSYADEDDDVLADFSITLLDGSIGTGEATLTPTQTAALIDGSGRWDLEIENDSDLNYDVGYKQILFYGTWSLFRDVTRE